MTISTTPRFGFKQYSAGTDPHPNRDEFNALVGLIESNAALFSQDVTASRPAAGKTGRYFWDKTVSRLYYDDGTSWNEVTTNGGGGAAKPVTPNVAGTEGTSARSARADHTHNLPLATASADGAMPATDKALINTASAVATPGSLMKLDGAGRSQVAGPSAAADIANKSYVDAETGKRALTDHSHDASDVVSGTFAVARLPIVTVSAAGAMLAADKVKLDNAVAAATASRLVVRDAAGRAQFAEPSAAADVASKGYVDGQVGTRALTGHTHDFASITSKPATYPADWAGVSGKPTIFATNWASIADIPSTMPSTWATVSGKPSIFPSDWPSVAGKPATFPPVAHSHVWADITDVPATFTPAAHTHSAADINSGTLAAARLPLVTEAVAGAMSAADKTKLNDATNAAWANTLVMRDSGGRFNSQRPTAADHVATKDFCDDNTNTRASWSEFDKRIVRGGAYTHLRSPNGGTVFAVNDSGVIGSSDIYNTNAASGSYRALWVNSSGVLGYNLSSRKFKTDERDYVVPLSVLEEVTPKWFKYKHDVEELGEAAAPDRVNFIAEDLHDAGLGEYVSYEDEEHTREQAQTINEQLMVNALWSFAQQQQKQIAELQKLVAELGAGK